MNLALSNKTKRKVKKYFSLQFGAGMVYSFFRALLLLGISYVILYPLLIKLSASFLSQVDMYDMTVKWIPKTPTLENFQIVMEKMKYGKHLFYTLFISATGAFLQVACTTLAAYAFARLKFPGRGLIFAIVILTLVVPPQTYMVPSYMQFRFFDFFGLGQLLGLEPISLINTPLPLYIMSIGCVATKNGLFIYIMKQFFANLPKEIEEAAEVDGAGVFKTFFFIMLPNAKPALTTISVFAFVWIYNDLYMASTYMPSAPMFSTALSTLVFRVSESYSNSTPIDVVTLSVLTNAGALLIILPLIILFCVAQKQFVEGVERTGITG